MPAKPEISRRRRFTNFAIKASKTIAFAILLNAAYILGRADSGSGNFKLKSLVLTLEEKPVQDLLQVTEATYLDVAAIRFGALTAAGQATGNSGSFGRASPGMLTVDSVRDLDVRIDGCRSLAIRPGDAAALKGPVMLTIEGDCAISLLISDLRYRDGSASVLKALGIASASEEAGTIANADFVLERPSRFSLVLNGPEERPLFMPLPTAVAMTLELAHDAPTWVVERGLFRRCQCKAGDVVELGGPLSLKSLHMEGGELQAGIDLAEGSAVSCGPSGSSDSSCGFNKALINPAEVLSAALKVLFRGS